MIKMPVSSAVPQVVGAIPAMWESSYFVTGSFCMTIRKYSGVSCAILMALLLAFQTGCPSVRGGRDVGGGNGGGGDVGGGDVGGGDVGGGDVGGGDVGGDDGGGDVGGDDGGGDVGGDDGGGGDVGGDDGSQVTLTPVKTNIDVHNGGRIAVGDDLLVYGYGGFAGVDYIIPSEGDTEGRNLPDGDSFVAGSFAVSGKKIALVSNFLVTIFDTTTETATAIGENQIRLVNTPSGIYSQGHIMADGPYIACRNDSGSNDGSLVAVIDVSGDVPMVIYFTTNPENNVDHIAVDGSAGQVAASAGNVFYIYDINNPTAAPAVYDTTDSGGIGDNIFTLDGGYIFYEDAEAFGNARFLDVADGSITTLTQNPATGEQCHNADTYVYFVDRDSEDSNGGDARSGVGAVPAADASLAGDTQIDGSTTNNGFLGWSQACSVTPDGAYAYISGMGSIGSGEFLQVSTGGAFSLIADPDGSSQYGLPGTDVATSATLVGFKTGDGTTAGSSTKVGYIILGN